jgi:TolA-binding protein
MRVLFWVIVAGFVALCVGLVWYVRRRLAERRQAEEARMAAFVSGLAPAPAQPAAAVPAPGTDNDLAAQKLLFEAAHKAGEAGEPAIAIQLYARLLARYPASPFAAEARTAVQAQKRKLAKA